MSCLQGKAGSTGQAGLDLVAVDDGLFDLIQHELLDKRRNVG